MIWCAGALLMIALTMPTPSFDPRAIAGDLARAWHGGDRLALAAVPVADTAQAYLVQDAFIATLGGAAGWKVGATSDTDEPGYAPLPAVTASGSTLGLHARSLRGIELEVAVRLRHDLLPGDRLLSRSELADAIAAVMPAIEVVDSRLAQGLQAPAPERIADLHSHRALVVGDAAAVDPLDIDTRALRTRLWVNGDLVTDVTGAHPAPDLFRLLAWLARHAQAHGMPLRAGQVVTTGSCTGILFAPKHARVEGEVAGLGRVDLRL